MVRSDLTGLGGLGIMTSQPRQQEMVLETQAREDTELVLERQSRESTEMVLREMGERGNLIASSSGLPAVARHGRVRWQQARADKKNQLHLPDVCLSTRFLFASPPVAFVFYRIPVNPGAHSGGGSDR